MRPIEVVQQITVAADADGICLSQTTGAAGDLLINGALTTGGVATLDTARQVLFTSAGDLSAITFTITGTNNQGTVITESVIGPNLTSGSISGFLTVTQVSADAAVGTAVTVGTSTIAYSDVVPLDIYATPSFETSLSLKWAGVSNDADVTVQFTFDKIFDGVGPFEWTDQANLTGQTQGDAPVSGSLISPTTAVRLVTNSGTGAVTLQVVQAGIV